VVSAKAGEASSYVSEKASQVQEAVAETKGTLVEHEPRLVRAEVVDLEDELLQQILLASIKALVTTEEVLGQLKEEDDVSALKSAVVKVKEEVVHGVEPETPAALVDEAVAGGAKGESVVEKVRVAAREEAATAVETTAAQESAAVEENPTVDEIPAGEEKPAVEETAAAEEIPRVKEETSGADHGGGVEDGAAEQDGAAAEGRRPQRRAQARVVAKNKASVVKALFDKAEESAASKETGRSEEEHRSVSNDIEENLSST
jgi:predicted component of type VI protein secretion system